jgi:tetratricopeptide (TPR) repeat protein
MVGPASPFAPARQLSLTQANLLAWAAEEYAAESASLLRAYEASLPTGESPQRVPQDLQTTKELANSVHHFAHALVHLPVPAASGGDAYSRAVNMRKKVYQLLRRNLVAWKSLQGNGKKEGGLLGASLRGFEAIRADWPELLKVTSTAGQHLLSVAADDVVTAREKRHVAGEILAMMQEMLRSSHEGQHDAILLMVADIHQQIGVLDLAESHSEFVGSDGRGGPSSAASRDLTLAALQHFQLALEVTTRISERSGRHLLVAPMILTANALASLAEFSDAFPLYEEASRLNAQHLGPNHQSNIALHVDHGISLLHSRDCQAATTVLDRALALLRRWEVPLEATEHKRAIQYHEKAALQCGF